MKDLSQDMEIIERATDDIQTWNNEMKKRCKFTYFH